MILQYIASMITAVITTTGYGGLFLFSALESCAIPIPSEIVLPFSGFLAASGHFNIALVIIVATLGNWLGSLILYAIGKSGGRWILEKYGRYVLISREELIRAENWFARHGHHAIFWSRMLPIIRTYAPFSAGVTGMKLKQFNVYTVVGSFIWNFALAWAGYKAGEHWDALHPYFQKFDIGIGAVIVTVIVWWIARHLKRK